MTISNFPVALPMFPRRVLLLLILIIGTPIFAAAEKNPCIARGKYTALTFFLVDKSDKLEDTSGLEQSIEAVKEMIAKGERLVVGVSTGKLADTRIVLDLVKPAPDLWASKLKIRADEKKFEECLGKMATELSQQDESYKTSAILETLSFVSDILDSAKGSKRVVMYSDMIQNSESISFYRGKNFNPESVLKSVESEELVYEFPAVKFYVAGAGRGLAGKKARRIKKFWKQYFARSGAELAFYGPIFLGP